MIDSEEKRNYNYVLEKINDIERMIAELNIKLDDTNKRLDSGVFDKLKVKEIHFIDENNKKIKVGKEELEKFLFRRTKNKFKSILE